MSFIVCPQVSVPLIFRPVSTLEQGGTTPITWSPAKVEGARCHVFWVVLMLRCNIILFIIFCVYIQYDLLYTYMYVYL